MADISFDVPEGFYLSPFTTRMILSGSVQSLQFSVNGAPPSISRYVAYDQLTPPNPFIAVTQDGNGNVVYDGGFPKFYNSQAPTEGIKDSVSVEFNATCDGYSPVGNCYYYNQFSAKVVTIASGDKLVYDILMNDRKIRAGIDGLTNAQPSTMYYSLRDWGIDYNDLSKKYGLFDQNNIGGHPATDLGTRALNKWYHREFDLTKCVGFTFRKWTMAYEGEEAGDFSVRFRDIYIIDKNGRIKTTLFKDTLDLPGNSNTEFGASGYSNLSKLVYDPRAQLTASFKYLYNAILWVANEKKFASGNRNILIMGDVGPTDSHSIKSTQATSFYTSLSRLVDTVGFKATYVDITDYPSGMLDTTLAKLEEYVCVLLMSSGSGLVQSISDKCVQNLVTYRENGSGLIVITDDGPVFTDISQASPPPKVQRQFFATANRVVTNFGAYFSGLYDRTPVNVGFLRETYGDHPLYGGMDNSESIFAGASESRVQVQTYETLTPDQVKEFNIPIGKTVIRVAALLSNGSAVSFRITYHVGPFDIGFTDGKVVKTNGETLNVGVKHQTLAEVVFNVPPEMDLTGVVSKNGVRVGTASFSIEGGVSQTWDSSNGGPVKVKDGDQFSLSITNPFNQTITVDIERFQPAIKGMVLLAEIMDLLREYNPDVTDIKVVEQMIAEIGTLKPSLGLYQSTNLPNNLKLLGDYFNDEGLASTILSDD